MNLMQSKSMRSMPSGSGTVQLRRRLIAALVISGVMGSVGCRSFTEPSISSYPPPPQTYVGGLAIDNGGNSGQNVQADTTVQRPQVPSSMPADNQSQNIVRGQDPGYSLPPLFDTAPDGSRHNREPLPVSGQPAVSGQAKPQAPAATVAQKPQQGILPPPSTSPQSPMGPPGTVAPAPMTTGPMPPSPVPSGFAPQGPIATYGTQPPGFESLPEISPNDLNSAVDPGMAGGYVPRTRYADIFVNGYPARTGRLMFGGAVNSDAGVTGQVTVEERNFDITRFPRSFQDLVSGTAFRGAGQTFRLEAMPGTEFQRYTVNFVQPYLFNYLPISFSTSAFLFDRRFEDWDEQRLGGRMSLGYRITQDLSLSAGIRAENVEVRNPRVGTVAAINDVLGDNEVYSWQLQLVHDTRNSPFTPSEGHYFEASYENVFGDYDFGRTDLSFNRYFLVRQRADRSGKQTLTMGLNVGFSGEDTPVFENFFAGGYSTMRGFAFRGASPTEDTAKVGGRFKFIGTVEYMFPLTADDMLRGVAFVDYGTVERDIEMNSDNFRVAPGFGIRIAIPALGPAPLAFDLAFPIEEAAGDERQVFAFSMGLNRRL